MPRQAVSVLSAIAALTGSLCALTLIMGGSPAHAVEDCAAAPKSPPPQGSHWYYRTDRASHRKCWYLAPQTRKVSKASRMASQVQSAAEPTAPSMEKVVERPKPPAELEAPERPALPAESRVATPEAAPTRWPNPSVDATEHQKEATSALVAQDYARKEIQNLGAPDEGPMQQSAAAAGNIKEPAAAPPRTLQFVTGGLAAMGFLTSAFLYLAGARRRRRTEVQIVDLNAKAPLRAPATVGSTKPPAPIEMIHRHDEVDADIEDRLRQFSQAWRRRAA